MYVAFGTNRYWALCQLEAEYAPTIISLNQGTLPPREWGHAYHVLPTDFKNFAPPGRVYVTDPGFGWELAVKPEEEFKQDE
jgi:hypothetical protein